VDGANGVGAPKAKALFALIGEKSLKVELVGTSVDEAEKLNKDVRSWLSSTLGRKLMTPSVELIT